MYPKCHFVFLINWKNLKKFKILYLDFVFTSIWETKFKYLTTISLFRKFLLLEFLMLSFRFSFSYKIKNEIQFIFRLSFSWRNYSVELPYGYLLNGYFHKYSLHVILKQVRFKSADIFHCTMVTRTPGIHCLENSVCISMFILLAANFILIVNCDVKHISRSSHREVFS